MKKKDRDILSSFFSTGLSKRQDKQFRKKAATDKDFVKELLKMSELNEVLENDLGAIKARDTKKKHPQIIKLVSIALGSAAILAFGLFIVIEQSSFAKDPGNAIFEEYYEPFDLSLTRSFEASNSYAYLYSLYMSEDYAGIMRIELEKLDAQGLQEMASILKGISAVETENYSLAKEYLSKVEESSSYYNIARWYSLMLRIQENIFNTKTVSELKYFAENDLLFMEKAEGILDIIQKKELEE